MGCEYEVVRKFEQTIAEYCGAKYGVAVSSCTNAIFLCLKWLASDVGSGWDIEIPKRTYVGVAMSIFNAGFNLRFRDIEWHGAYDLRPYDIVDSALRFQSGMHRYNNYTCLSFHNRKHIPIGRGGMILTDNLMAVEWLKMARFDGRKECPTNEQKSFTVQGWNFYMTPEQAARGLVLFNNIKDKDLMDINDFDTYPDLSEVMKPLLKNE